MAQTIRAFQTPDKQIVRIDQLARVSIFDNGVGLFDERHRMIGWIETHTDAQSQQVSDLLLEIINNPRRAKQPDWGFIVSVEDGATAVAGGSTVVSARTLNASSTSGTSGTSGTGNAPSTSSNTPRSAS